MMGPDPEERVTTLLYVDDDGPHRRTMTAVLSDEFMVVAATDGVQAVRILEQTEFDIVCTDYSMPNLDGIGLLSWVVENRPHMGRVLMTGMREHFRSNRDWSSKAHRVVLKPYDPAKLIDILRSLAETLAMQRSVTRAASSIRTANDPGTDS